jgi:uncharacterized cupredoxin-like copper-binding protein
MNSKPTVAGHRARRVITGGVAVAIAVTLAGCGGSGSKSPPTSTAATATGTATPSAGGQGTAITVDEADFKINLSTMTFTPGTYTFVVKNTGHASHALEIDCPGVEDRKSDTVSPGGSTRLTVTLQKGSYELYCPVDGHKGMGMDTHITVS